MLKMALILDSLQETKINVSLSHLCNSPDPVEGPFSKLSSLLRTHACAMTGHAFGLDNTKAHAQRSKELASVI